MSIDYGRSISNCCTKQSLGLQVAEWRAEKALAWDWADLIRFPAQARRTRLTPSMQADM